MSSLYVDREEGDKLKLRKIQDAVRNDKSLQDKLKRKDAMAEFREKY